MELLKNCPVCNADKFEDLFMANDYLVTKNDFQIIECSACGFAFTNPRPAQNQIKEYYKSDDYSSHSDGKKSLFDRLYSVLRNRNISYKLGIISSYKNEVKSIFDYGCGIGSFLLSAQKKGWQTVGFEPNEDARDIARNSGLNLQDIDELIKENKCFDVISLWHVLEHIHNINDIIPKLKALLKNDGLLIVAVPNISSWDAQHYQEKWAALDVPRHLYHFSDLTIEKIFSKFGMKLVKKYPLKMDAYYISLLSEQASILKYFKAVIKGWYSNFRARKTINYSSQIFFIQKSKE